MDVCAAGPHPGVFCSLSCRGPDEGRAFDVFAAARTILRLDPTTVPTQLRRWRRDLPRSRPRGRCRRWRRETGGGVRSPGRDRVRWTYSLRRAPRRPPQSGTLALHTRRSHQEWQYLRADVRHELHRALCPEVERCGVGRWHRDWRHRLPQPAAARVDGDLRLVYAGGPAGLRDRLAPLVAPHRSSPGRCAPGGAQHRARESGLQQDAHAPFLRLWSRHPPNMAKRYRSGSLRGTPRR